jgi:glycosyltransferase involved in cell wall biosynthesis
MVKVSVCIMSYNQEAFIAECLDSVIAQKTSFPFEIIIADDASTDQTAEIIKEYQIRYPSIIKPIFRVKNLGPSESIKDLYVHARGVYIAHMDGDDYALPGKLQKQADFLDGHEKCSIVFHQTHTKKGGTIHYNDGSEGHFPNKIYRPDLFLNIIVATHSSKMFRAENIDIQYLPGVPLIDYYLHVEHLRDGFAWVINDCLGVYRKSDDGATYSGSREVYMCYLTYMEHYMGVFPECKCEIFSSFLSMFCGLLVRRNWLALKFLALSVRKFSLTGALLFYKRSVLPWIYKRLNISR